MADTTDDDPTDDDPTDDDPTDEERDPRTGGHGVLALWSAVYDFDSDVGGFARAQFLLRDDGVLFSRNGGDDERRSWDTWRRWVFEPGPFDPATAYDAATSHWYTLYPPGPAPIEAVDAGPFRSSGGSREPLRRDEAHLFTAPAPAEPEAD